MEMIETPHSWKTNDAAEFYFDKRKNPGLPATAIARRAGHVCLVLASEHPIQMEHLELIGQGLFGEARPSSFSSQTRWTGSSHRYAIYLYTDDRRQNIVIAESHGGGTHFFYLEGHTIELWTELVAKLSPERLWDLCYMLAGTYDFAQTGARDAVLSAFAEGRLRKRRSRGKVRVELLPAAPKVAAS